MRHLTSAGLLPTLICVTLLLAGGAGAARAGGDLPLWPDGAQLLGDGPDMVEFGAGAFNILKDRKDAEGDGSPAAFAELRFGRKLLHFGPVLGLLVNTHGGGVLYGGVYSDVRYRGYVATPSLSVAAYKKGSGPDLGGTLQFRSALTLAYELDGGSRIGIRFAHVSNAGLHARNPGENEVLITYAMPF